MARPRVFISSTFYDLKHIRASLESFVQSLGYEPILAESGDIPYVSEIPLEESCYRDAETADIFVLIIGSRYGSLARPASGQDDAALDANVSITRKEYESARRKGVQTYVLVESAVFSEYETYRRNSKTLDIDYAHVDNVKVFHFMDAIRSQSLNNAMHKFDRFEEISDWLRDQWAGQFRELLRRKATQNEISNMSAKVEELGEINKTLRKYLEVLLEQVKSPESKAVIVEEAKRLSSRAVEAAANNPHIEFLSQITTYSPDSLVQLLVDSESWAELREKLRSALLNPGSYRFHIHFDNKKTREELNRIRIGLGKPPLNVSPNL